MSVIDDVFPAPPPSKRRLPFSSLVPVLAGAFVGVVFRLMFMGEGHARNSPMVGAFIAFVPFAVGAFTVYMAERTERRTWGYYAIAGALANVIFVLATMAILIEGLICAVLIVPLFAITGALAGLIMGAICRSANWPKKPAMYSFAFLPLLLATVVPPEPSDDVQGVIERKVVINADAPAIWHQMMETRDIKQVEVGQAWMYRIGVPTPESGVARLTPQGLVREIRMGKGIHFRQVSTEWETNRYVRWQYRFDADSFPPGALDDHVKIGGDFFDLADTEYFLEPAGPHQTTLTVRMRYRVSTQFNWYAKRVASGLIGNFEENILALYAKRSS